MIQAALSAEVLKMLGSWGISGVTMVWVSDEAMPAEARTPTARPEPGMPAEVGLDTRAFQRGCVRYILYSSYTFMR
jgi:hypothetical protein